MWCTRIESRRLRSLAALGIPLAGSRSAHASKAAQLRIALSASFPLFFGRTSKCPQEGDKVFLLLLRQVPPKNEVEILYRVVQGEQSPVMQIWGSIFDAAQRECLDWSVGGHHHSIHHVLLVEALRLQIVHGVVGVVGRLVAGRTLSFPEENFLPVHLGGCRLCRIKFAVPPQLGSWLEVEQLLKFRHEVNLAAALEDVHTLLGGDHRVS